MTWRSGDFYRICDRCGAKVLASTTAKEWQGLIVCRIGCFEIRHPQDLVRGRHDRERVNDPKPEDVGNSMRIDIDSVTIDEEMIRLDQQGDYFLDTNEVTASDL